MAKKIEIEIGANIEFELKPGVKRPLTVTSVNKDGTVNGRLVHEPKDNPTNDGTFQTFFENVKV